MRVNLSGNLLRYIDFDADVEIDATSVLEALQKLGERYPAVRPVLFDDGGRLRSVHRVTLNGELQPSPEVGRSLGASDEVVILTPIAGG